MGACFLLAGAAILILVPMLWVMAVVWVFVGLLLVVIAQLAAAGAARRKRLLETGEPGRATILQVSDTGVTINNSPRVRVRVRIDTAGGQSFEATTAMTVSRVSIPRVGDVYEVRFDPNKHDDFVFASPSSAAPRQRAIPAFPSSPQTDTIGQLERLARLRDQGALTAQEFETQKRKLLG
jgi:uncharacterized protein (DUF58 family)